MKVLLDTCTFLWIIAGSKRLSATAERIFRDPNNAIYLSAISVWEFLVKNGLGKLSLRGDSPGEYIKRQRDLHGITPLPLDESAVLHEPKLPKLHAHPFDRMLVCQALEHGCTILTPDERIAKYPIRITW
jgi:PIN domain nuclease of toxin-antitoxin system